MYTLIHNQQLSDQQFQDLELLCVECKKMDGNNIPIYPHLLRQIRTTSFNLLYYKKTKLLGFLSTFFFYEDAYEIALMVAPDARKKGIARKLLTEMMPHIPTNIIKTFFFSSPSGIHQDWFLQHGYCYKNSEYQMQKYQNELMVNEKPSLTFQLATLADISTISAIDAACFSPLFRDPEARFYSLLSETNYRVFLVRKDGFDVGKAHIRIESDHARLSDIAVLPAFQGQGIGRALLVYCLNYCITINVNNIVLDVETNNRQALNLYTQVGFNIKNAYDFWSIPTKNLGLYFRAASLKFGDQDFF